MPAGKIHSVSTRGLNMANREGHGVKSALDSPCLKCVAGADFHPLLKRRSWSFFNRIVQPASLSRQAAQLYVMFLNARLKSCSNSPLEKKVGNCS